MLMTQSNIDHLKQEHPRGSKVEPQGLHTKMTSIPCPTNGLKTPFIITHVRNVLIAKKTTRPFLLNIFLMPT